MKLNRLVRVAVEVAALAALAGCAAHVDRPLPDGAAEHGVTPQRAADVSERSSSAPQRFAAILRGLQAKRIYVMAGDDVLHAGLGTISRDGLEPWQTRPGLKLLSSVYGNGRSVIVGGVAVDSDSYSDGVYLLRGDRLIRVAQPGSSYYGPTVSPSGTYAAVRPSGGFFTKAGETGRWQHDPRSGDLMLSSIAWDSASNAYAIIDPGRRRSRLVGFPMSGETRMLDRVPCATNLLAHPGGDALATKLHAKPRARCGPALIVRPGRPLIELPAGWDPLLWSADGRALLLSRGHGIGLWDVEGRQFTVRAAVEPTIWMAAVVERRG